MSAEKLDHTVVRDHLGRIVPGSAPLNPYGRQRRSQTVAFRLRQRYAESGERPDMVVKLIEELEGIALNPKGTIETRDQLRAITDLLRMYAGRALFDHAGDEEGGDLAAARPARQFFSVNAVDRQAAAIAEALGTTPERLPEVLEAALEYRESQLEAEAEGQTQARTA